MVAPERFLYRPHTQPLHCVTALVYDPVGITNTADGQRQAVENRGDMSWNAYLQCECCGNSVIEVNYTHNINGMANLALNPDYQQRSVAAEVFDSYKSWWTQLDGMTGVDGAAFLDRIITAFDTDPEKYRALNPRNGWGNFDTFRERLVALRDAVPGHPTRWKVYG